PIPLGLRSRGRGFPAPPEEPEGLLLPILPLRPGPGPTDEGLPLSFRPGPSDPRLLPFLCADPAGLPGAAGGILFRGTGPRFPLLAPSLPSLPASHDRNGHIGHFLAP